MAQVMTQWLYRHSPIAFWNWREPSFLAVMFATISVVCTIVGYGGELVLWLLKS
jgi:hypothetical protein